MAYVRIMICLLVLLWSVIGFEVTRRRPPSAPPSELIAPAAAQAEPLDLSPILNRPVGDIIFKDVELDAALRTIHRQAHVNIVVYWRSIEKIFAVTPHTRVTVSLCDVTLESALDGILQSVKGHLHFGITPDGTIVVTADAGIGAMKVVADDDRPRGLFGEKKAEDADEIAVQIKTPRMLMGYDIRDIAPNCAPLPVPPATASGGGGGGGLFSSSGNLSGTVTADQLAMLILLKQWMSLVPIVRERGEDASEGLYAGRLLVAQTPRNHRRLREILRQMRLHNTKSHPKGTIPWRD